MSFHEKAAWAAMTGLIIFAGVYFWHLQQLPMVNGVWQIPSLAFLITASLVMVVVVVAPLVLTAMLAPSAAEDGPDERERMIEARSGDLGHMTLQLSMLGILYLLFNGAETAMVFHTVVAASTLAGMVEYGSQIVRHRLGS